MKTLSILVSFLLQSASWANNNTSNLEGLHCSLVFLDKDYSQGLSDKDMRSIPMVRSSFMGQPSFFVHFQIGGINYLATAVPATFGKASKRLTVIHAEIIKTSEDKNQFEEFYLKGSLVLTSEKDSQATLVSRLDKLSEKTFQQIAMVCKR